MMFLFAILFSGGISSVSTFSYVAVPQHEPFHIQYVSRFQSSTTLSPSISLRMTGNGDGGDKEWAKALFEASGDAARDFEQDMKMQGLMKGTIDTNPKLNANKNLIDWLQKEGNTYLSEQSSWGEAPHPMAISTETVDEITNESSGRGLLARRDVNDGDQLLCIPMKLCLTIDTARKTFGEDVIEQGMNEYLAIALQLIHEKYMVRDKSTWKEYIDILPTTEEVSPTFTWPDSDLEFLQGSPVVAASLSLRMKLQREYHSLLGNPETGLIAKFPNSFPATIYTFEKWEWAFTMLFSRAIRLRSLRRGEALAMVPYADLINHSSFSQCYIDARESGDWLFKTGEEEVIIFADRGYRRMEQIYISYGPKSNAELLLLYGFAVERNPYNSVDVTVSIAPRTESMLRKIYGDDINIDEMYVDPLAEEKLQFLESVGRENTVDFPCYADRYPVEMLEYLRLMQMTEEDTRGKPLSDFDYSRAISTANEAAVLSSVVDAVKRQLSKYPQSEDDDAAIIKDKKLFRLLTYNQRMAVRHRRNEKRLLKRTIAALERQMQKQGLDVTNVDSLVATTSRAEGSTLGVALPGGISPQKQRTALEDRLEKMGLPVDLR
jgi:Rubisco LSMT substrate-binding/SET domain